MLMVVVCRQRSSVRYQFAMDLLDFWLPASNIGLVNLNEGALGLFGLALHFLILLCWES
jgi:peroxin-11B